jgi:N-acetylglucosamine-6-phosphate deacetylase
VDGNAARLTDTILAGSILSLDKAVRNLSAFTGCTLADALRTATYHPADLLGLPDRGRLLEGGRADLVFIDQYGQVAATFINGHCVYNTPSFSERFKP